MNQLKLFIDLTRLKKPIGFMLLFWPCIWGLTLVYDFSSSLNNYFFFGLLFLTGSILMRSAGCIVNDIVDRNFDKKVERTKNRPIASGKVSVKLGIFYTCILCILAFLVLINFNYYTVIMALISMPLAFSYPLMKRITYWPQLFLGITFNYGLVLAWISIANEISAIPLIFYFGAIFWTLGYDTIYGFQDIKDDEIIGLKSTAIKFKSNPCTFLYISYSIFIITLILIGFLINLNIFYFIFLVMIGLHMYYFQIFKFNFKDPANCLKIFKSNNLVGLLVFIGLLVGKI
mgnify:CR=1 FL=1